MQPSFPNVGGDDLRLSPALLAWYLLVSEDSRWQVGGCSANEEVVWDEYLLNEMNFEVWACDALYAEVSCFCWLEDSSFEFRLGPFSSERVKNTAPFNHVLSDVTAVIGSPLLPSSAGLRAPGQWFHWLGSVASRISPTRFVMKAGCRLDSPRIYWNTVLLSIHR